MQRESIVAAALVVLLATGCGGVSTESHASGGSSAATGGAGSSSAGAGTGAAGSSAAGAGGSAGAAGSGPGADAVKLGEQIFDYGTGPDGQPIPHTGGVGMNMNSCASCHGVDGHGRKTMMFSAPDITYANLTDPAGMIEPDGTRGPTYTDALIRRAVVEGIGADGDALDTTMPRWQLDDQEWADLLAYLQTLK